MNIKRKSVALISLILIAAFFMYPILIATFFLYPSLASIEQEEIEWSGWKWSETNSQESSRSAMGLDSDSQDEYEYGQKVFVGTQKDGGVAGSDIFQISAYIYYIPDFYGADIRARIRKAEYPYDIVEGSDIDVPEPPNRPGSFWLTSNNITLSEPISGNYCFCVYINKASSTSIWKDGPAVFMDDDNIHVDNIHGGLVWIDGESGQDFYPEKTFKDFMIRVRHKVGTNVVPTANIDLITPNPADVGELVTFKGSGEDVDGDIVWYEWNSEIDEKLDEGNYTQAEDATFSTRNFSPGPHSISFRVRDDKESWSTPVAKDIYIRSETEVAEITPRVEEVYADFDGFGDPGGNIGTFVSGISLDNTFTAQVSDKDGKDDIDKVIFELMGSEINGNYCSQLGTSFTYEATFDMSDLPEGGSILTVTAYDKEGHVSEVKKVTIHAISKPGWFDQTWILNSRVSWDKVDKKYIFKGDIPHNPSLHIEQNINIPYLGDLENLFDSGVHITESFSLAGDWERRAEGHLNAKLLGTSLYSYSYSFSTTDGNYEFTTPEFELINLKKTVYNGIIASFNVLGIQFSVTLSIDFGFNAALTISGTIRDGIDINSLQVQNITVTPVLSPSITIDLALDILFGTAKVGGRGTPTLDFCLPIVYSYDDPNKLSLDDPCVHFVLKLTVYVELFWGLGKWDSGTLEYGETWWPEHCSCPKAALQLLTGEETVPTLSRSPSIASDDFGHAMAVWVHDEDPVLERLDPDIYYSYFNGSQWSEPKPLDKNDKYETDPEVVFYDNNKAMAVWTQNMLTEAESSQITDLNGILNNQELYYSLWDGLTWSSPLPITNDDNLPDGRVSIAAGSGQLMATWVHDADGDASTNFDWEIHYSLWDNEGANWTPPAPIPGTMTNIQADAEPYVKYDLPGGLAMAVWVTDADNDFKTNQDRVISYALWNGNQWGYLSENPGQWVPDQSTTYNTGLAGVLWPTVAFDRLGNVIMVFTSRGDAVGQDPGGNQTGEGIKDYTWSSLYNLADGSWSSLKPIGVEFGNSARWPKVNVIHAADRDYAITVYRGFKGYGTQGFDGEIGFSMMDLTSEASGVFVEWSDPELLSNDSYLDWQMDSDVDASGVARIIWVKEGIYTVSDKFGEGYDNIYLKEIPFAPDLSIDELHVRLSSLHPDAGEKLKVTAIVRNSGLEDMEGPLPVKFYIDDPTIPGNQIGEGVIDNLPAKSSESLSIYWPAKGGLHSIYVVIDPENVLLEIEEENNIVFRNIGEVPPPANLVAFRDPATSRVKLIWDSPSDIDPTITGIIGFKVYRSIASGSGYQLLSSTETDSHLDRDVSLNTDYYYVVTCYDEYGVESEFSEEAKANIGPDSDNDGLPDLWEESHFGDLSQGANDDPDGDSFTNLEEYNAGTDPDNAEEVPGPQHDLTISSTSGGSVTTPGEGTFTYDPETVISLVAEADEGYRFIEWTGDVETIADVEDVETTITMEGNYSIIANFKKVGCGCFIATAAYGTPMAAEIEILRKFRDEYLLTSPVGQALVDLYYTVSPPIAEFIAEHPSLKPIVRAGLVPAVAMSAVAVNTSPAEKAAIAGLLVLASVAVAIWVTRRR